MNVCGQLITTSQVVHVESLVFTAIVVRSLLSIYPWPVTSYVVRGVIAVSVLLLPLQDNEHVNGCGLMIEMVIWIKMEREKKGEEM